jgi:hypothetical protein
MAIPDCSMLLEKEFLLNDVGNGSRMVIGVNLTNNCLPQLKIRSSDFTTISLSQEDWKQLIERKLKIDGYFTGKRSCKIKNENLFFLKISTARSKGKRCLSLQRDRDFYYQNYQTLPKKKILIFQHLWNKLMEKETEINNYFELYKNIEFEIKQIVDMYVGFYFEMVNAKCISNISTFVRLTLKNLELCNSPNHSSTTKEFLEEFRVKGSTYISSRIENMM